MSAKWQVSSRNGLYDRVENCSIRDEVSHLRKALSYNRQKVELSVVDFVSPRIQDWESYREVYTYWY